MKSFVRILLLLCLSILATISVGCDNSEISPLLYKDKKENGSISSDIGTSKLNYTIDKLTLSNSYQSVEPSIEIIKNGLDTDLLLSLGLIESSSVNIEGIEKSDNNVSIYIQNESTNGQSKLVVPQIILHFDDLTRKDMENLNFEIINKNYEPIKTSIDIGEAISKIEAALKISTSTFPEVRIEKENDQIILDLAFTNVVDLKDKKNPIINLDVLIDLCSSHIINSSKSPVSSLIDQGEIIEYLTDKYIVYIKEESQEDLTEYNLYLYDIEKDEKNILYTSENKISSFKFNDSHDEALIIESLNGGKNQVYLFSLKDLKLDKLELKDKLSPSIAIWKDDDILLVEKNNKEAKVYKFNIANNELNFLSQVDKGIKKIEYLDGNFLFSIENDDLKEVYITDDFKDKVLIDIGSNPSFINNEKIGYLKENKDSGEVLLWVYNLKEESIKNYSDINIEDFFLWKDHLGLIEKNQIGTNNPLSIYDYRSKTREFKTSVKNNKVFFNTEKNILYINSCVVVGEEKIPVISFINLKK